MTLLHFRNYLAICTNEKFEGKVAFIDNIFFVSSVKKVKQKDALRFKAENSFYIWKSNLELNK